MLFRSFTMLILPIQEHGISLHLLVSSLISFISVLPFVLGFCLSYFVCLFLVFLVQFLALVITGGLVFWFGCSLLSFFLFFNYFIFFLFLIIYFYFNNFILFFLSFFLSFFLFLHLLLSHVADRIFVLWPGVRTEPLRWEN